MASEEVEEVTGAVAEPLLEVSDLYVDLPTAGGTVHAVRGLSFTLRPGRALGIVGESGSGKSVTALAIMGLLPAGARVTGSVRLGGRELVGLREKEYRAVRGRRVAMVFQDPMTSLNPVYTAGWQVAEAVRAHQAVSRRRAWERAVELLDAVGIADAPRVARSHPHRLSGGMRQRVVIAIAMANEPEVILADEPTTALDVTVQSQVLETLGMVRRATGAAMVLITHDLGVMAGNADEVLVMYGGRAVEVGSVDEVFYRPSMPYTVGLLGSLPRVGGDGGAVLTPI
ncbi:MAG: ABC transporter ATP-binding protein, partial [Acidimicrobiales bacterium]